MGGDGFARVVSQTILMRQFEQRSCFEADAVGPELLPIPQLLIDRTRSQFGGALQPVPNLLVSYAAILIECAQTKPEQDDTRKNDRHGKTSQHCSDSNAQRQI